MGGLVNRCHLLAVSVVSMPQTARIFPGRGVRNRAVMPPENTAWNFKMDQVEPVQVASSLFVAGQALLVPGIMFPADNI